MSNIAGCNLSLQYNVYVEDWFQSGCRVYFYQSIILRVTIPSAYIFKVHIDREYSTIIVIKKKLSFVCKYKNIDMMYDTAIKVLTKKVHVHVNASLFYYPQMKYVQIILH